MAGLAAAFGSGAMTNSIEEIEHTKIILVTGSNTTANHSVIGAAIKRAVKHHGAKLIVADPRKIELTEFASCWLSQKSGTDIAWINGLLHIIIAEELYDKEYVVNRTEGFEEVKKFLEAVTPDFVSKTTGILGQPGLTLMEMASGMAKKTIRAAYIMGENLVAKIPELKVCTVRVEKIG